MEDMNQPGQMPSMNKKNNQNWLWAAIVIIVIGLVVYLLVQGQNQDQDNNLPDNQTQVDNGLMNDEDNTATTSDDNGAMMPETVTVNVVGTNFEFSQKEIRVKQGDTVKINFSVTEGFHDWVIDEFNARTNQMGVGQSETIEFVADKAGTYEYYCSVMQHRANGMVGKLIVE